MQQIKFNLKIYEEQVIIQAIKDYSSFLKIETELEKEYININYEIIKDHKNIIEEFSNYILALSKQEKYSI